MENIHFNTLITSLTLLAWLAVPGRLASQDKQDHRRKHHHYQLIDMGTFGAQFQKCDLRYADFTGANLTGANLAGANLEGVNLQGAILTAADLTGADLTKASVSSNQLADAIVDEKTILPNGKHPDGLLR